MTELSNKNKQRPLYYKKKKKSFYLQYLIDIALKLHHHF